MKKTMKIKNFILLVFLCLLVLIHIIYFSEIRAAIPNNEEQYVKELHVYVGSYTTPRHVADRFVWCFCLSSYFLIGYLWAAGQHYHKKINIREDNQLKLYSGIELICQIGMLLPYIFFWLGDTNDINALAKKPVWECCLLIGNTHYYLYDIKEWNAKYFDIFVRLVALAPIMIQISVYSIYCLVQYIQYKRKGYLERKWKRRHFIYISVFILIITWTLTRGVYLG